MRPRLDLRKLWLAVVAVLAASIAMQGCRSISAPHLHARSIRADRLLKHISVLASDDFEGRAPATPGEEKTVDYLTNTFARLGLAPGGPNGSFVQPVPMLGLTASEVKVMLHANDQRIPLGFPTQAVVWTKQFVPEIKLDNSELVFVGYGVVAPEYSWDDYKGVDVRGKTIVMLINDPPVPDPSNSGSLDEKTFKGRSMTYYGRWTYKFEIAAEKGAAAALIVHETGPAGYPWAVVMGSNSRENFDLATTTRNTNRVAVEGWITGDKARELFAAGGHDFEKLKQLAASREFRPVPLGSTASISFKNTMREVRSRNVIAKVEGTDPQLKNEYVVYSAHWDHLGRDPRLAGDQVFNGARDNASGTAALLEVAAAFAKAKPTRTVLFLSVTAEEKGLLGAKHYAREPLYPLERTVADINMDSMNVWGRTRDITVIGLGQSTLEDMLNDAAQQRGRHIAADPEPEKGRYFRSDHFEFAKAGVPGLYTHEGVDFIGRPPGFGREKSEIYVTQDYHKVSDEIKADWDLSGAADDAQLLFEVGLRLANSSDWPEWKPGSEFRMLRFRRL